MNQYMENFNTPKTIMSLMFSCDFITYFLLNQSYHENFEKIFHKGNEDIFLLTCVFMFLLDSAGKTSKVSYSDSFDQLFPYFRILSLLTVSLCVCVLT